MMVAADVVLNSRANDEDASLVVDSRATLDLVASLLVTQRDFTNAVMPPTPWGKGRNKGKRVATSTPPSIDEPVPLVEVSADEGYVAKDLAAADPVVGGPIVHNASDPRQALLHHVETLVELEQACTKGLKEAAKAFHASVEGVLSAY
ncbi:hypothetical protein VE00_11150 [Pseudogymnoascus sp. WSF 3629]|nr:hypothetical protein VE00_11150 [Pseudogymnoascus sp. WSF 3629]